MGLPPPQYVIPVATPRPNVQLCDSEPQDLLQADSRSGHVVLQWRAPEPAKATPYMEMGVGLPAGVVMRVPVETKQACSIRVKQFVYVLEGRDPIGPPVWSIVPDHSELLGQVQVVAGLAPQSDSGIPPAHI